ncbi:hypothetical protein RBG61_00395 [Paludicola sp. MB14-C6]|uniref:hypothetical protein n=1 Tax=Paludihabitans sp. MB14-C6 TaxID=3070656 RepID=UPI0027DBC62C|nr:hypothetical protein [Paludicola sp. MB14-C6]WMJ23150.1 hypothetical protein RBG61_00395 [Paludicola sp. MB14-C6]
MKNDIDEIAQWYDRFIENVIQISMEAEQQIQKLHGTEVADEVALDFCEIGLVYAKKLLDCEWITHEQYLLAENIAKKLDLMTQKQELWNEKALLTSIEWEECRIMGKKLLDTLIINK